MRSAHRSDRHANDRVLHPHDALAIKQLNIRCTIGPSHWIWILSRLRNTRSVALRHRVIVSCRRCASTRYRDAIAMHQWIISIDTAARGSTSIYGYRSGSTPQLDEFARSAIVFDDLYSHVPLTLPSHASLLTGLLPTHHGVRDNVGYTLGPDARTLATRFKAAGYATGAAVSSYVLRHQTGIATGFDFFDDAIEIAGTGESLSDNQRDGRISVDALADWIDRQSSSKVFALLHLYEPHTPYAPPPSHRLGNPYDGEIAYADELVGRLFERLEAKHLLDRAIVAVVSDHGEGLGDHGESEHGILLYRESLHVPGILRLPGGAAGGRHVAGHDGARGCRCDHPGPQRPRRDPASTDGRARSDIGVAARDRDVYAESLYPRLHFGWSDLAALTRGTLRYIRAPKTGVLRSEQRCERAQQPHLAAGVGRRHTRRRAGSDNRRCLTRRPASHSRRRQPPAEIARATSALRRRQPSASNANLTDPKDGIASFETFKKALATEHAGRIAEAIQIYRSVLAQNPRMVDAWESLAKALVASGQTRDAIAAFRSATDVDPLKPEPQLALARIYAVEGQPALARQHAEIGSQRDPAQGFEIQAALMMDAARLDQAEAFAKRSLEADPARYMSEYFLGVIAQQRAKCSDAIPHFERAIDRQARGAQGGRSRISTRALADCLARTGREADAEREFKAELAVIPDSPEARRGLAALYKAQGRDREASALLGARGK